MNRFTIRKLTVSGGGHQDSIIEFTDGLNLIIGPSNTGKSLIMDCIDYVFGFTPKVNRPSKIVDNSNGYTHVELELKTDVSVDKTDLEALLNICGTIDLNNYQENGKAEFKAAYEYALSIFNEADATEQEIRDAMNRLLEAKKNLKEIEVTPTDPDKNGQDKPIDNKVETGDNINVLYSASGLALASIVFYFSKKRKRSN